MKEFFARLNPTERRFVVGVAVVFFLVINIVWVWPHFGDWSATRTKMDIASGNLGLFESGTNLIPGLKKEIEKYQKQGELVPPVDQAVRFVRLIQNQTTLFNIIPESMNSQRQTETNNPFFFNQTETMSMQCGEKQLVDFLYSLGAGTNSMIRVKALSVTPDGSHQRLAARVTLVASYQKKAVVPATAAATATAVKRPVPEAKPAVTPQGPAPIARGGIPPGVPTPSPKSSGVTNRQIPSFLGPTGAVKTLTPPKK